MPFFNHMLDAVATARPVRPGGRRRTGDVEVDAHHTVEDVGICLGQAFREALGDRQRHPRFGEATIPMDETLVTAAVDFGGRAAFVYRADALKGRWVGDFDAELAREFFGGFVGRRCATCTSRSATARTPTTSIEALFKAFARATARGGAASTRASSACRRPRGR